MDNHMPPDPSAGPDARAFSDRFFLRAKSLGKLNHSKTAKKIYQFNLVKQKKVAFPVSVRVPVSVVEISDPLFPEYYVQHLDQEKLKNDEIEYQIKEVRGLFFNSN